jgi:hypothetical protein
MRDSKQLMKEIDKTDAAITRHKKMIGKGLESPACYALPLLGFIVGLTCQRFVPAPKRLLSLFITSLTVTKHLSLPHK